jgi:hypothetical protein
MEAAISASGFATAGDAKSRRGLAEFFGVAAT